MVKHAKNNFQAIGCGSQFRRTLATHALKSFLTIALILPERRGGEPLQCRQLRPVSQASGRSFGQVFEIRHDPLAFIWVRSAVLLSHLGLGACVSTMCSCVGAG